MKYFGKIIRSGNLPTSGNRIAFQTAQNSETFELHRKHPKIPPDLTETDSDINRFFFNPIAENTTANLQKISKENMMLFIRMIRILKAQAQLTGIPINLGSVDVTKYGLLEPICLNCTYAHMSDQQNEMFDTNSEDSDDDVLLPLFLDIVEGGVPSYATLSESNYRNFLAIVLSGIPDRQKALMDYWKEETHVRETVFGVATDSDDVVPLPFVATRIPEDPFLKESRLVYEKSVKSYTGYQNFISENDETFQEILTNLDKIVVIDGQGPYTYPEQIFGSSYDRFVYQVNRDFQTHLVRTGVISMPFRPILKRNYSRYYSEKEKFIENLDDFLISKYQTWFGKSVFTVGSEKGELGNAIWAADEAGFYAEEFMIRYRNIVAFETDMNVFPERFTAFDELLDYDDYKNHVLDYNRADEPGILIRYYDFFGNVMSSKVVFFDSTTYNTLIYFPGARYLSISYARENFGAFQILDKNLYLEKSRIFIHPNRELLKERYLISASNVRDFLSTNDYYDNYRVVITKDTDTEMSCKNRGGIWYLNACHYRLPVTKYICQEAGFVWYQDLCHTEYPDNEEDCLLAGLDWTLGTCIPSNYSQWGKEVCDSFGLFYVLGNCQKEPPGEFLCVSSGYTWKNGTCYQDDRFNRVACEAAGFWFYSGECFYYPPYDQKLCEISLYIWYLDQCHKEYPKVQELCETQGFFWWLGSCHATLPDNKYQCTQSGWKWYSFACHVELPNNLKDCSELNGLWYLDSCNFVLPSDMDICISIGYKWYEDACHYGLPDNEPECTSGNYSWINNRCYDLSTGFQTEIPRYVCVNILKLMWFDDKCQVSGLPTIKEDCLALGDSWKWYAGICTTTVPENEQDCVEADMLWVSDACYEYSYFPKETCTRIGKYWYNNRCNMFLPETQALCNGSGFYFIDSVCRTTPPLNETECGQIPGWKWYNNKCNPKLPTFQILCEFFGYRWSNDVCYDDDEV